jgi:hypothetical protein
VKTDLEVIDGAIALIDADGGWCKGSMCRDTTGEAVVPCLASPTGWAFMDGRGSPAKTPVTFCLEGALQMAAGCYRVHRKLLHRVIGDPKTGEQYIRLNKIVYQAAGEVNPNYKQWDGGRVMHFNDDERTSKEDAILALKTARSYLEGA